MFAEATGDHQWIHVDVERCKTEMPDGKTIAHDYLTLSLVAGMVPVGSRVRMRSTIKAVEDVKGDGVRIISDVQMEREGEERPVMIAETIGLAYA